MGATGRPGRVCPCWDIGATPGPLTGRYRARVPCVFHSNDEPAQTLHHRSHHPNARSCTGGSSLAHPTCPQQIRYRNPVPIPWPTGTCCRVAMDHAMSERTNRSSF